MQYTINELKLKLFGRVFEVYEIFQNFFEPQFVDLQDIPTDAELTDSLLTNEITPETEADGTVKWSLDESYISSLESVYSNCAPFILVYWPRVTVTNENDRSVQIQDLYAKVTLTIEGRIPYEGRGFYLNRTTFSEIQFTNGYLHSHVPHFRGVPHFETPCLGSGPINNTILDLKNGYEEALWMLFCQELSLYVTVESLTGGPYFRLESIGSNSKLLEYECYNEESLALVHFSFLYPSTHFETKFNDFILDFTRYYLEKGHLSFNYKDNAYIVGMPHFDYIIDISNAFIDYANERLNNTQVSALFSKEFLQRAVVSNGQFYKTNIDTRHNYSEFEGRPMFVFKGECKCLHIDIGIQENKEIVTLLNHRIAMFILSNILKIINYRYKNEHTKQLSSSSTEDTAPTYQTVIYL